jgi:hypothetical protein
MGGGLREYQEIFSKLGSMKRTMEVPEMLLVDVVLVIHELMTFCPGAKMSTTEPKLEKDARASAIVVAPTVFALGARAGDVFPASPPSLPAATVT